MKIQIKVITLVVHQHLVAEALEQGGYVVLERSHYDPLKGICFLVGHPDLPFELDQDSLKDNVRRWLYRKLGHELFFVIM